MLGQNATLSFVAIPPIMLAPAPLAARQWAKLYDLGKPFGISLSLVSTAATAYVAYYRMFPSVVHARSNSQS